MYTLTADLHVVCVSAVQVHQVIMKYLMTKCRNVQPKLTSIIYAFLNRSKNYDTHLIQYNGNNDGEE